MTFRFQIPEPNSRIERSGNKDTGILAGKRNAVDLGRVAVIAGEFAGDRGSADIPQKDGAISTA